MNVSHPEPRFLRVKIPGPHCSSGHLNIITKLRAFTEVVVETVPGHWLGFLNSTAHQVFGASLLLDAERLLRTHRGWLVAVQAPESHTDSSVGCPLPCLDLTDRQLPGPSELSSSPLFIPRFPDLWAQIGAPHSAVTFLAELLSAQAQDIQTVAAIRVRGDSTSLLRSLERATEILPYLVRVALRKASEIPPTLRGQSRHVGDAPKIPKVVYGMARAFLRERTGSKNERWHVVTTSHEVLAAIALRRGAQFPAEVLQDNCEGGLADPCSATHNGITYRFAEAISPTGRGSIASIQIEQGLASRVNAASHCPNFHSSFPFLLSHNGALHMIPEESQAARVALYRLSDDGSKWTRLMDLLPGFPGVDSVVVEHANRWWLLTSFGQDGAQELSLHLFSSAALYGEFQECACSPIRIGLSGARNAGPLFTIAGQLFRPAQECSRRYGEKVRINRVVVLSESSFIEEPWCEVSLVTDEPSPRSLCCHTISGSQSEVLLDTKLPLGSLVPLSVKVNISPL